MDFRWVAGPMLLKAAESDVDTYHSLKDPSVVYDGGAWHLFCSVRGVKRSHQIEYLRLEDWDCPQDVERTMLSIKDGYYCAPEVFYYRPHEKWYLLYQAVDDSWPEGMHPAVSTSDDVSDPLSWSDAERLVVEKPEGIDYWIDFWIICDADHAYMFFTSPEGRLWRTRAAHESFPQGWSRPEVALDAEIFEASHIYKLKGREEYIALIEESSPESRRYFKAYLADSLDGEWLPVADTLEHAFASMANVRSEGEPWTTSFSHGELIRVGRDELLEVDPDNMVLLFQGVSDEDREASAEYGLIPWKLGLLHPDL